MLARSPELADVRLESPTAHRVNGTRSTTIPLMFTAAQTASWSILLKFDEARAGFCAGRSGRNKKQKWSSIDLNATISRLDTTRSRIVKALNYLEEQGDLTFKVAGLRQGYRIKTPPTDISASKSS